MKIVIDVPDLDSSDLAKIRDASPALVWDTKGRTGVPWKAGEGTKLAVATSVEEYREPDSRPREQVVIDRPRQEPLFPRNRPVDARPPDPSRGPSSPLYKLRYPPRSGYGPDRYAPRRPD